MSLVMSQPRNMKTKSPYLEILRCWWSTLRPHRKKRRSSKYKELQKLLLNAYLVDKTQNMVISGCFLQNTTQSYCKVRGSCAVCLFLFTIRPTKFSTCDFVIPVAVVDAKTLYRVSYLLVVFSVTPFKIDQNKKSKSFNRLSLESGNRKKVDMQRLSPRFRSQQFSIWKICGETFFSNL